jgi:hypothetical protein
MSTQAPQDDPRADESRPLHCPQCGRPLIATRCFESWVYNCADHGRFFIAREDGQLYEWPTIQH